MPHALQIEDALGAHIKQEVEHTQIGQEAVFLLVNLIIGARLEIGIGQGMLGIDGQTEVGEV